MKMAYKGPHAAVDVPDAGLYGVQRGEPVDIEDASTCRTLKRQGWTRVREPDASENSDNETTSNEQEGDDE